MESLPNVHLYIRILGEALFLSRAFGSISKSMLPASKDIELLKYLFLYFCLISQLHFVAMCVIKKISEQKLFEMSLKCKD